jgi:NADPH-dependent 7-cyano-7-deazaguanine reductase QueF
VEVGVKPTVVPERAPVRVTVTAGVIHLCPHRDETDMGRVMISWRCDGATVELHSLRAWLDGYSTRRDSHETIASDIAGALAGLEGIADVRVTGRFHTAGLEVTVEAA